MSSSAKRRYRCNTGIDYIVRDADHRRVVEAYAKGEPIDPFDPANGIEMRRVEAGAVAELPARVVADFANTYLDTNDPPTPVIEEVE